MVDHEPMAHGSRGSGVACVVEHDGDDAGAIKRTINSQRIRCVRGACWTKCAGERRHSQQNLGVRNGGNALAHAKSVSSKTSRCAIMTTHVHDRDLDAAKPLRTLVWKVVRTQFAAKDPVLMQKFLGVVREAWDSISSCRGLRLAQGDYTAKILEDAVKLGFGPIRVCTTAGQSVTPLDPKLLPEQPCDPGVRELIGSLLFVSRCTRFDISFVIARLARFVTRWCEWARKEIRHILGFVTHTHTSEWSLVKRSANND